MTQKVEAVSEGSSDILKVRRLLIDAEAILLALREIRLPVRADVTVVQVRTYANFPDAAIGEDDVCGWLSGCGRFMREKAIRFGIGIFRNLIESMIFYELALCFMAQIGTELSTLGGAIRSIRISMAWSQSELAGKAGCSVGTIVDLERRNAGSVDVLCQLVRAMHGRWVGLPKGPAVHERVRVARQDAGLSLGELAHLSCVSKGALIRLERGAARVATLQAVLPFIAPKCSIKGPNIFRAVRSSGDQDVRFTPADVLDRLTKVLGPIGLDPCGDPRSFVRARKMFTEADDGLQRHWACKTGWVFVNPPFSKSAAFVHKGTRPFSPSMTRSFGRSEASGTRRRPSSASSSAPSTMCWFESFGCPKGWRIRPRYRSRSMTN